jgi:hypothetical protein
VQFFDPETADDDAGLAHPATVGAVVPRAAAVQPPQRPATSAATLKQSARPVGNSSTAAPAGASLTSRAGALEPALPQSANHRRVRSVDVPPAADSKKESAPRPQSMRLPSVPSTDARAPSLNESAAPAGFATVSTLGSHFFSQGTASASVTSGVSTGKVWGDESSKSADVRTGSESFTSDVRGFAVPRDEARHAAFLGIHALAEDAIYDEKVKDKYASDDESDASDSSTRVDVGNEKPKKVSPPPSRGNGAQATANTLVEGFPPKPRSGHEPAGSRDSISSELEARGSSKLSATTIPAASPLPLSLGGAFKPASSKRSVVSSSSVASSVTSESRPAPDLTAPPMDAPLSTAGVAVKAPSTLRSASEPDPVYVSTATAAPPQLEQPPRGLSGAWISLMRRVGWMPTPVAAGLVRSYAVRRQQREATRVALVQRLPHYSTQVVRARVSKLKAQLRAQQVAEEQSASMLERRNSGRSSALSDSAGSRDSSSQGHGVSNDRSTTTLEPSVVAGQSGPGTHGSSSDASANSGGLNSMSSAPPQRPAIRPTAGEAASAVTGDSNSQNAETASISGTSMTSGAGGGVGGRGSRAAMKLTASAPLTEAIWTMKFSCDGQYLAVAGGSEIGAILRVWKVRAWDAPARSGKGLLTRAIVTHGGSLFERKPSREYLGHQSHIVDVAWSRSNLILSASMDSYVRLWHVSRSECLHKFQHPDCVTAVAFHPTEDNYFVTGCLDKKLRIWSLETGRVVLWQPTASMITSVAFSPDARLVAVGLYNGLCTLYRSDGLRYHTTIECKNRKGKDRKGRKVTGLEFDATGTHLLVSTNDSRLRLFSMDDFSQSFKYVGLRNNNMQIRATFDSTGDRIISGSEDRKVYIWRSRNDFVAPPTVKAAARQRQKVHALECFVGDDGEQPVDTGKLSTAGGPGPWCGCGSASTVIQPESVPRAPALGPVQASAPAAVASDRDVFDGNPVELDPDADDLEDRAELQAYYTSGRIATTVALFVPSTTLAINRPLSAVNIWKCPPTIAPADHDRLSGAVDIAQTGNIVRTYHFMVVAADSRGFIRVYENTAPREKA